MINKGKDWLRQEPLLNKLLSGSGLVLIFKLAAALGSYFFFLLLSKNFGAEQVGNFNIAFTIISIGAVIARMGLDGALVRLIPKGLIHGNRSSIQKLFLRCLAWVCFFALVLGLLLLPIKNLISDLLTAPSVTALIPYAAIGILPFALSYLLAETYRGLGKNLAFSLLQQGSIFLALSLLLFVLPGLQLIQVLQAMIVGLFIQVLFGLGFLNNSLGKIEANGPWQTSNKELWSLAFPMFLSGSAVLIMNWTDTLILAHYFTEYWVGIYGIAFKVASLVTLVQFALNTVSAPMISSLYQENRLDEMARFVKRITYVNLAVAGPTLVGFILFGPWFLGLFGEEFKQGNDALIILAIGQLFNALSGPVMYVLNMTAYEKAGRNTVFWASGINLVLNLALIPVWGLHGAAWASCISMVAWNGIAMIHIKRKLGFWTTGLLRN